MSEPSADSSHSLAPVAAPTRAVELLPDPILPALTRPLTLSGPHTYAAIWPFVRRVGQPAAVARELVLVRDDGQLCLSKGAAGSGSASDFLIEDPLPATGDDPPSTAHSPLLTDTTLPLDRPPLPLDRFWSDRGLQSYLSGHRPDPADVFRRLVAVLQHFFEFTGALAPGDPDLAPELLAAYILATWLAPALPPLGILWLVGDHGSGKSRLLGLLASLSHLGLLLPAVPNFSSLSRYCSLGAAIAVDDAHFLGAGGQTSISPARRALLLGGSQRGALFPLAGQGAAQARLVDVSGPRLFASTHQPASAIASQCLVLPLPRAAGTAHDVHDPASPASWPAAIPLRGLIDDLWALALTCLPELPPHIESTAQAAAVAPAHQMSASILAAGEPRADPISTKIAYRPLGLTGSALQPWHAILTVASWLSQASGSRTLAAPALLERLISLARSAQAARALFDTTDLTTLAVRAIFDCALGALIQLAQRAAAPAAADDAYGLDSYDGFYKSVMSDGSDTSDESVMPSHSAASSVRPSPLRPPPPLKFYPVSSKTVQLSMMIIAKRENWEILPGQINPTVVGRLLGYLGLQRHRTTTSRFWLATPAILVRLSQTYNVPLWPSLARNAPSHPDGP